jgi:hypothetical protein
MFVYLAGNQMYLDACVQVEDPSFDCRGNIRFNINAVEIGNKMNILILMRVSIRYSFLRSLRQVQSAIVVTILIFYQFKSSLLHCT